MTELERYRKEKDEFFRTHPQSPLTPSQKRTFRGLNYFPENPDLRLELALEEPLDGGEISMPTSTGGVQSYARAGRLRFTVEGREAELTLFRNDHGLFLPFVDSQAGESTYPAGRYLEPQDLGDGRVRVDFNLAYNPYCAYNEMWSCPITPPENRLKLPIPAGEKLFHK